VDVANTVRRRAGADEPNAGKLSSICVNCRLVDAVAWSIDSARGARLFTANPMDDVAAHFGWLLGKARRPVLIFVDDLDRCPSPASSNCSMPSRHSSGTQLALARGAVACRPTS
jgi:membrane-associated phospholipid phosphatase